MSIYPKEFLLLLALALLAALALKLFFRWLAVPIRMRLRHHLVADPRIEQTKLEHLTPEMQHYLGQLVVQFRAGEFEAVANSRIADAVPGTDAVQVLLVNRSSNDTAVIAMATKGTTKSRVFAIRSTFDDGTSLVTGVNPAVNAHPRNPAENSAGFPWVTDAATLCEVHRRRLRRDGFQTRARIGPAPGDEMAYLFQQRQDAMRWFVNSGYYWLDVTKGVYRFTWKGAFLVTWKSMEPIKGWRTRARDQKSWRLWEELGMTRSGSQLDRPSQTLEK